MHCFMTGLNPHPTLIVPSQPLKQHNIPISYSLLSQRNRANPYIVVPYCSLRCCNQHNMAERSDFAQKLLDDLRLRKERMAASQSSTRSNQLPMDAYAYAKQTYRGSRNVKASETLTTRSHRSANTGEASNQIVAYGRGQLSDMSLALAYAFENGGKLRRGDSSFTTSLMGFLHQIKRGTMDFSKMERGSNLDRQLASTSHFPSFSAVQINEISKGAQKLNQILRACSNGSLNMDRYSIEFAKELLQGAMDLQESLRMLVDLQRSSEFMKTSQKRNRITLLEEDNDNAEGDDDRIIETSEPKQLARPTFSFDKPSRTSHNLQENRNTSLMQRPLALAYTKERRNSTSEKQDVNTSKLLNHRRSTTYSFDNKINAFAEQKNQSASVKSNTEKARIPNVVARLMGLDNLPEKVESKNTPQKDSLSTVQKMEGRTFKHTATGSANKVGLKNKQTENLVAPKMQKVTESINVPITQEKEVISGSVKNSTIQNAISEVADHDGKTLWRDLNGIKASKGLEKATIKVDKQPNSAEQMNLTRESWKDVQVNGRKQDHTINTEQKGTIKGRTNDSLLNNMLAQLEQAHERSEADSSLQEEKESIGSILQSEKKHTNKHNVSNQKKSQNSEKNYREKQVQHSEKQMFEGRQQKRSETTSKNSSKPPHDLTNSQKKQPLINQATALKHNSAEKVDSMKSERFLNSHYDDLNRDEASHEFNVKVKQVIDRKPDQITSRRNQQSEPVKGRHGIVTLIDEKSVHKVANKKVKNTIKKKTDFPEKIEEVLTRRNGTVLQGTKQVKQQSPILQELRQRTSDKFNFSKEAEKERVSMLKEADECIISSNGSVAIVEPLDVRLQPHKETELPPTFNKSDGGKVQSLEESAYLVPKNLYQDVRMVATNDMQHQNTLVAADKEFKSCEIAPNTINGIHGDRINTNYLSQWQDQRISEGRTQEPLTESENCLKWILVMSQPFLNTAEALFKLNIPFGIFQGDGGQDYQDEDSKLVLDCSYEVMKRKGIRHELKVHPCSKISISSIRIRSLDDLVRHLNEDMEKLKFYGRNRTSHVDVDDYLPKMLENDVYNKYPDIDCMWDLGWNEETFAFLEKYEVTRDMEKHILNGLLDEITWELLNVQGGLNATVTSGFHM